MPRGSIDWKSAESYSRLLAAMVAANDMKLNYKKIADMYGKGATYDAIEGRFRVIRKEAEKLKTEIDNGVRPLAPMRGNGRSSTQSTPRKSRNRADSFDVDGVLSGRISKSSTNTPTKQRRQAKPELLDTSTSTSMSGDNFNAHDISFTDLTDLDDSFSSFLPHSSAMHDSNLGMAGQTENDFLSYAEVEEEEMI